LWIIRLPSFKGATSRKNSFLRFINSELKQLKLNFNLDHGLSRKPAQLKDIELKTPKHFVHEQMREKCYEK
jgi:hypothetical protein